MATSSIQKINLNCKEKCDDKGMPHGCCTNYTRTAGCETTTTTTTTHNNDDMQMSFAMPFYVLKMHQFTKTGSGQTQRETT
jgi:hypothetical protein